METAFAPTRPTRSIVAGPIPAPPSEPTDEAPLPPPEESEEIPQRTLELLGQARDALVALIGSVFQAVEAIVEALLRLVQAVGGRDAAEAVDQKAADVLDPLIPNGKPAGDLPAGGDPDLEDTPSAPADPDTPPTTPPTLQEQVRDILLAHAASDAEREAVSPALVDMVTSGVQFMLSVERHFPGAVDALQERGLVEAPQDPAPRPMEDAPSLAVER